MKAIVLGGCGILGLSLLTYLKEQQDISEILITDIQEGKLKDEVAWLKDKRFSAKVLDATDNKALVAAMKGHDIVLNTSALPKLPQVRAALEAGVNYLDCGFGAQVERAELDKGFKKKGLLAIINVYYAPGLDNIAGALRHRRLDKAESVDFRWARGRYSSGLRTQPAIILGTPF